MQFHEKDGVHFVAYQPGAGMDCLLGLAFGDSDGGIDVVKLTRTADDEHHVEADDVVAQVKQAAAELAFPLDDIRAVHFVVSDTPPKGIYVHLAGKLIRRQQEAT